MLHDAALAALTWGAVTCGLWSLTPIAPNVKTRDLQTGCTVVAGACAAALTLLA